MEEYNYQFSTRSDVQCLGAKMCVCNSLPGTEYKEDEENSLWSMYHIPPCSQDMMLNTSNFIINIFQ